MAGIKNENNGRGSRIIETGNGIIGWPIRVQYMSDHWLSWAIKDQ